MEPIQTARQNHKMVQMYALFSGGDDSLASVHYSMNHGADSVIHISTGIGVNERSGLSVLEFVIDTCASQHWPLRVMQPPDLNYRSMVLKYGFPGPGAHRYPYSWLKERCIAQLVRESKKSWKDRIGLCTGVRISESARRMGYVAPVVRKHARIWIAPFYNKTKLDVIEYSRNAGLKRSPIAELIGMSGECFCGAFAKPDELETRIRPHFPKLYEQIVVLQAEAKDCGVYCEWGKRPRRRVNENQLLMPLCVNCHGSAP